MQTLTERRAADCAAHEAALRHADYQDDEHVAFMTRAIMRVSDPVFQVHRLAPTVESHVSELLKLMDPPIGALVLDVGCGVGAVAHIMKALRPGLQFTLLNVSVAQLAICPPDCERVHADMHAMPVFDGSFDVAMYCYSLGHGLLEHALPEAARVLKYQGILFIYDLTSDDGMALDERLHYRAHTTERVIEEAEGAGFCLRRLMEFGSLDVSHVVPIFGPVEARLAFEGARPVLYRFIKADRESH